MKINRPLLGCIRDLYKELSLLDDTFILLGEDKESIGSNLFEIYEDETTESLRKLVEDIRRLNRIYLH